MVRLLGSAQLGGYDAPVEDDVLERLRAGAAEAFDGTPVVFAYLFGSHARGQAGAQSDVDVAVFVDDAVTPDQRLDLELSLPERLSSATSVPRIDVLVLNGAPLPVRGRATQERQVIYSRDEPARVDFEVRTRNEFLDFQIHAEELDRELLRRMRTSGRG